MTLASDFEQRMESLIKFYGAVDSTPSLPAASAPDESAAAAAAAAAETTTTATEETATLEPSENRTRVCREYQKLMFKKKRK
jgi:hypothetical protein